MVEEHLVIIGAGVLGLTCALELSNHGYRVTVIGRELPGDSSIDYASPWAGAHFRPTPVNNSQEAFERDLMQETYTKLQDLAKEDSSTGIQFIPAVEYFEDPEAASSLLKDFSSWPGFSIVDPTDTPNESIHTAITYDAWVINTPVYLAWLQRQAELRGVTFIRARLNAVAEAYSVACEQHAENCDIPRPTTVVNASGMGFEDVQSYPSRGQFLIVSNPYDRTVSHHAADGVATVVIPRPLGGGTVIGGTKEPHNWSAAPSSAAIAGILDRVSKICPDMLQPEPGKPESAAGLHVLKSYVARRPMRHGGLRLETEQILVKETAPDGFKNESKELCVVHCYGAGPSGYKISWGVAGKVRGLISKNSS
ncbi:FAD dependent oxidoreductase superfamily [Neofusicoccum parvum]|uniref:FAD dependent oxidoreductase superfamily n=1 Tax=Neofusicoccum parvum TaxID=310453 RepID=A0ACB5SHE4_9PEZI|nr:FAD dependent oxidoreductase superfamily [Neofusicoccum parvum]